MKKKIMIVDDSALMRKVMCDIINSDSSFEAVDFSKDGQEAYEKLLTNKYDAILLDINMPRMDGLELLRKLHKEKIDCVVIMASTLTSEGSRETMTALELGAVDFVTKPGSIITARGEEFADNLLNVLSGVLKVQRKSAAWTKPEPTLPTRQVTKPEVKQVSAPTRGSLPTKSPIVSGNKLIALACSTGGPKALQSVVPLIPKNINAPMVLVQHMPVGFTKTMADRLNELSQVTVKEAEEGDVLQKGCVYVAPGGKHLQVIKTMDGKHKVHLDDSPAIGGLKPCANIMYESLKNCGYDEVVCVVLTGMGADGTEGIVDLRTKKQIFTISQDEKTCVVYGMPRAIYEAGVVNKVVPLTEITSTIITNVGVR